MPPSVESWSGAENHEASIRSTLETFTFDRSSEQRARSLQNETNSVGAQPKRPSTLAEDLLRVKTNLERAMAVDPSPMTILPGDLIVQSIETECDSATTPVYRKRSPVADVVTSRRASEASLVVDEIPIEGHEEVEESIETRIEVAEKTQDEEDVQSRMSSRKASRESTPEIVKSKFEALEMFSRDGTPLAPRKNPGRELGNEDGRDHSLDEEFAERELDEDVRRKLEAVGALAPRETETIEASTHEPRPASDDVEDEVEDVYMEDAHDEFLQSKLEAIGFISRQPTPAYVASRTSSSSTSASSNIKGDSNPVETTEVYDEFLRSKLEAMGVIPSVSSPSPKDATSPRDDAHFKLSSPQTEVEVTSPPAITVESVEPTSQGDTAPPFPGPALPAAVSGKKANPITDDHDFLDIPSQRASLHMSNDETPSVSRESSYSTLEDEPLDTRKESIVEIRAAELIHPLSRYDNYERPLPVSKERDVVKEFKEMIDGTSNADHEGHSFIEFDFDDYMIYLPGNSHNHPYEMTGLQNLNQYGHAECLIDGILSLDGDEKRYVEGIPFQTLSIGTYGKEHQEITGVWIQTRLNANSNVHYHLRKPHRQYERFHTGFMWLANLAKNFIDYSMDCEDAEEKVSIHNFRRDFYDWMVAERGDEASFKKWYAEYGNPDFRTVIASNIEWLAKEAIGSCLLGDLDLDVFAEVRDLTKIPFHKPKEYRTIVTPFVYECFKEMAFGRFLKKVDPNADTDFRRKSIGEALHLSTDADVIKLDEEDDNDYEKTTARLAKRSLDDFKIRPFDKDSIAVGDVLAVVKDSGHVSKWKSEKTQWSDIDECWFVYIQSIEMKRGRRSFRVLWMYRPEHTSCALMKYPFQDELFLSAHCECEQKNWFTEDQVICRVSVAWGGNHGCKEDFFVRQRFHQHNISFTTLKESDKKCEHLRFEPTPGEEVQSDFEIGSTVLVQPRKSRRHQRLEPCEIMSFNEDESVTVRRLLRRREAQPGSNATANELVYTDQMLTIPADQVHHECQVRFYSSSQVADNEVPPPYSLNGSCDFFYICTRLIEDFLFGSGQRFGEIDILNPPPSLIQGFDPKAPPPKNPMRGLDLYCGGGNMGRGLEDGGAVRFTHVCDYQDNAIASYYANTEDTEHTKFFSGSVNDLLKHAMKGNPSNISGVPLPGDIEFISAGSPCQGFSNLNPTKNNDESLRNQSMVADVASMVDFYRPKYAVLENVVNMAQKGEKRREDCLSQLICCLVGMGYQLQVNLLDAWSFGCPQRRTRLFVVVAAPDLAMPKHPDLSHSHPESTLNRGLGVMANGVSFGQRIWDDTAFKWQSAEEATADLPDIGDGQTGHCTPFPDHRTSFLMKDQLRKQLGAVPLYPPGMNAKKAWPRMSHYERSLFATKDANIPGQINQNTAEKLHNSFERVQAGALFPTITTVCAPQEKFNGRVAHWSQQRVISILEAKRAQGFLDTDVLVGTRKEQYKIVGNSVARPVALAEGMALRRAWLQNEDDNPSLDAAMVPITVRDDVAQLELPSAPSSKGSEIAYRKGVKGLSSNSEMDDGSSASSATPQRRESQFSVIIPARKSIVEFRSSPVPEGGDKVSDLQTVEYGKRSRSPVSALPFTTARPGAQKSAASAAITNDLAKDGDVQMYDASPVDKSRPAFNGLPKVRPSMAEVKKLARKRHRMMGGATPGSSRVASEGPAPPTSMSRADISIVEASRKLAHLGRRRSQDLSGTATPMVAQSRFATPASRPASRPPAGSAAVSLSRNDASIAHAAQHMNGFGRRRSQTASQQVSRAVTPREGEDDEVPRTAKRRKLPSKPILPGSAERPITLDDSEDEVAPIPIRNMAGVRADGPAARAKTPMPVQQEQRASGWTAVNTPPSANNTVAQFPLHSGRQSTQRSGMSASPAPTRGRSRQPRPKKVKKPKEPFVIDLTADDDNIVNLSPAMDRAGKSRNVQPYQPVDNSAWMGMMFTKSRLGGLEGVDEGSLLGMDVDVDFGAVEEVRRAEGGGVDVDDEGEESEVEVERRERREVVYAY